MTALNVPIMGAAAAVGYRHGEQAIPVATKVAFIGHRVFGAPLRSIGVGYAVDPSGRAPLVARFRRLADQWLAATVNMSMIDDMITHPAYLEIIGMGPSALPLLLDELERAPNHWFAALIAVSGGQNPVEEDEAGDLDKMTEAWMRWAQRTVTAKMLDPASFPNLQTEGYTVRSPKTPRYNCIAWAAGETHRWWWYNLGYYWPTGVPRANSLEAFVQAFATLGFSECENRERANPLYEADFDRVALYALIGAPKHAAKQIDARTWSSKIGNNIDIEHTLRGLEGPFYGNVVKILKRPKAT